MARGHKTGTVCCVLVFVGVDASAAEWSAQPAFAMRADVDTNRRLTDPATPSNGATFSGSVDLARVTAIHQFSLRPRVDVRRYDKEFEVLDSNDFGADLKFARQGEHSTINLRASAADDSTLTTELADTGIVEGRARRRTLSAGTDMSLQVRERAQVQAGLSFDDVEFDDAAGTGLAPYRYPGAFVGFVVDATDRSQLGLNVSGGRFDAPSTGTEIDSLAVRASWRSNLNERFSVELNAGVNRSESAFAQDQGPVFGLTGNWNAERSSWSFTLGRDVEPSANGRMVKADSVSGSWRWNASERITLSTSLYHTRREDLLFGSILERRDYSTIQAAAAWRLDSNWNLELRASAAHQEYERSDVDAHGARIAMSVLWTPRKYAVSR